MEKLGLEEEDCRMRVSCEIGRQNNYKIFDKKFDKTEKINQNEKFDQREEFDQKEKFNQTEKFDQIVKIDQKEKFDQREEFDQKIDQNDKSNDLTENEGGAHQSFNLTMSKALMEVFT